MQRTLYSFVGTGNYKPAYYTWKGQEAQSPFMPVVLNQFFEPDRIVLFMTKEARAKHYKDLSELPLAFEVMDIPTGGSEVELWELFDCISSAFQEEETAIIDVTHGFRFQPLLGITAAIYLQTVKSIQVERIVYGAFDPNSHSSDHRAPIFDLTPLLDIIEWSQGSRRFHERGDAGVLKELIQKLSKRAYVEGSIIKPKYLSGFANKWEDWTNALSLNRISQIPDFSQALKKSTEQVREDLQHIAGTTPLRPILSQISQDLNAFLPIPPTPDASERSLSILQIKQHWEIVQWYLSHNQFVNALTLANEIIVSIGVVLEFQESIQNFDARNKATRLFGSINKATQDKDVEKLDTYTENQKSMASYYHLVSELRNDINHCGFRDAAATKPNSIIQTIHSRLATVKTLIIKLL